GAPGPSAGRSGTEPLVLLHGDVHTANAIVSPAAGVVLIDYDQGGLGRPGADVAGLLAQLETLHLCGRASAAEHAVHRRAVLEGYATVRPLPADLAWHEAAALLAERALRAVNGVRVPVLAALAALLDAARGKLA
ncbi:MAG: phosphotransferase family protein, partial [Acidimicrobiales bacterium]